MPKISTISINFDDGTKEYLSASFGTDLLALAIDAANNGRPVYFIDACCSGYQIRVIRPDSKRHEYVSGFRNGEYTWHHDYAYAKDFSLKTALKHVHNLYATN